MNNVPSFSPDFPLKEHVTVKLRAHLFSSTGLRKNVDMCGRLKTAIVAILGLHNIV
jgi:hypothetical protein